MDASDPPETTPRRRSSPESCQSEDADATVARLHRLLEVVRVLFGIVVAALTIARLLGWL